MQDNRAKNISYLIIIGGILVLLLAIWTFIPKGYNSDTSSYVFMTLAAIRSTLPILGIALIIIGNAQLSIIRQSREQYRELHDEVIELRKSIERITGK